MKSHLANKAKLKNYGDLKLNIFTNYHKRFFSGLKLFKKNYTPYE